MREESPLRNIGDDESTEMERNTKDFLLGKEELDRIVSLQSAPIDHPPKRPRGGTSPMALEKRKALAEHMRRYWANKKQA